MGITYHFEPIAWVQSPFKIKYGIPRQPSLAAGVRAVIKFRQDPDLKTALRSLEGFSHLWLIFVFHQHGGKKWKPSIRPPRLGGRQKVGVLASRSPHRPNPIGLSLGKIEEIIEEAEGGPEIVVSGVDVLDGTPILDIKPYLAYADYAEGAQSGWAQEEVKKYPLRFTPEAECQLAEISQLNPDFKVLLQQMMEIDPRPSFQKRKYPLESPESEGRQYGLAIHGYEIKYEIRYQTLLILKIDSIPLS